MQNRAAKTFKCEMINFDNYTNENKTEDNSNWPDIDKIYLHTKNPYEAKYQYLLNKREKVA